MLKTRGRGRDSINCNGGENQGEALFILTQNPTMKILTQLFALGIVAISVTTQAAITSVSVEKASQDYGNNDSYPARDNIWSATVPPYPFNTSLGIAHILDTSPSVLAHDISPTTRLGVLHSHKYDAPYVPVFSAVVTFTFDFPTVVDQLEILQHVNGVTRVEGFIGGDINSLASIGNIFGPDGDARGAFHFTEGQSYLFDFDNSVAGTIFQFRITQTSLENGYALHRAFPRLSDGTRIEAVPEPAIDSLVVAGLIGVVLLRKNIACIELSARRAERN